MLLSLRPLYGKKLGASDGDIGHVKDFYFNDQQWAIRYVVADTGSWLSGPLGADSSPCFRKPASRRRLPAREFDSATD
jgi:hypothetical protein